MKKLLILFNKFFSWIGSLFKKKEVEPTPEEINKAKPAIDLMKKMIESGEMNQPENGIHGAKAVADLQESARKRNQYVDMYNDIKGFNQPDAKLAARLKREHKNDKAILEHQLDELLSDERPTKPSIKTTKNDTVVDDTNLSTEEVENLIDKKRQNDILQVDKLKEAIMKSKDKLDNNQDNK